jgi:hypothetical protein
MVKRVVKDHIDDGASQTVYLSVGLDGDFSYHSLQLRLFLCVFLIVVDGRLKGLVQISGEWSAMVIGELSPVSRYGIVPTARGIF